MGRTMTRTLMWACGVFTILCGVLSLLIVVGMALAFQWSLLFGLVIALILTGVSAAGTIALASEEDHEPHEEQVLLSRKQRHHLNKARGSVLYERGLLDVAKKRDLVDRDAEEFHRKQLERGEE